jgi:RHS repeat-associated protein
MSGTEFQTGEWGLDGLDLNYFAARYYDPILGRWHAPDPLEQCHSPYLAMLGDPANFIDPDGRAGIPFLQDFMKSDGGTFLFNLAGQATFLGAMLSPLGSIGGTISNIVSIGASLYSTGSSVKNLAEFTSEGSTKTYARYDFSAEYSMMKSSRHAGMAFDVRYSDDSSLQVYNDDESIADLLEQIKALQNEIQGCNKSAMQMQTSYTETMAQIQDLVLLSAFFDVMSLGGGSLLQCMTGFSSVSIDQRIQDLQTDASMFQSEMIGHIAKIEPTLRSLRERAVRLAWRREYENVINGGRGLAKEWSKSEREELLKNKSRPRVSGYQADHILPVEYFPEHAGDPDNIQFLKGSTQEPGSEHYNKHFTPAGRKRPRSDFDEAEREFWRRKSLKK